MRFKLLLFSMFLSSLGFSQDKEDINLSIRVAVQDSIFIDSVSINPIRFAVKDKNLQPIDSTKFTIDFKKSLLILSKDIKSESDSITIEYVKYPEFLTRKYYQFDPNIIVDGTGTSDKLYELEKGNFERQFTPFDGLTTSGSITRGLTVGNNQNAVVNSELDLQITGKLSDKVSIRASIQDANVPTQEGGYSQSLNEFDQIFIELFSDNWNIRAGDVDLTNTKSYFGRFNKKVQGISLGGTIKNSDGSQLSVFGAGALVRGVFQRSQFTGQEGNQGPYKLIGPNGELFILIVSGSERVYVNGILLERGENNDYVIDYNAGEITFNTTYPITANMRISVEYQFTDRSYTRFIGYGGGNYSDEKFDIGTYVYSESDAKNQPLQQNLSEEQVAILQTAGDDMDLMTALSAVPDTFSENKTLYRKETLLSGEEIFIYSNNPADELFNVRFTLVGNNQGDYVVSSSSAINRIFEYVSPINGIPQGNYEPIIRLQAPTKLQIGGLNGNYRPSEKTTIDFEVAGSKNDLNLFSNLDDDNNNGFASRIGAMQQIVKTSDSIKVIGFGSLDYINRNFRTIERLYNIEFSRDWNLINPLGNQRFATIGTDISSPKYGNIRYEFQNLDFSENFSGRRNVVGSNLKIDRFNIRTFGSYMDSKGDSLNSKFLRINNTTTYSFKKAWVGGKIGLENNRVKLAESDSLTNVSQRFNTYEVFTGIGDSTQVFAEVGYLHTVSDSLRNSRLQKVNSSNSFYIKSRPINGKNAQLNIFANYRILNDEYVDVSTNESNADEQSLSTRILYNQALLKNGIRLNTALETSNGVIPQQEFTYVEVEAGQGVFTWIDYNENGIQELEEFEVAQFQDEATFVRVLLPNQIFLKIRQNKFSQTLTLNPQTWSQEQGFKRFISHFYNQTSYLIDRKVKRDQFNFDLNPFGNSDDNELGLTLSFRNALFFNRGKQKYTTNYTYLSTSNSNLISLGLQENILKSHQLTFTHKFWESWLVNFKSAIGLNQSISENFSSRNFEIDSYEFNPKISYLLNRQTRFDLFYEFNNKENLLGEMEKLNQQTIGTSFAYNNVEKISINGELNYINNNFSGSAFSPVAYQILEGLQPGSNFTWRVLLQKRITKYLDANLTYFGRKSETSRTVHTGNLQLRAFF